MSRGKVYIIPNDLGLDVEWRINNFFPLSNEDGEWYRSPDFPFDNQFWFLGIYPNGCSGNGSFGHIDLSLSRKSFGGPPIRKEVSIALRTVNGQKDYEKRYTRVFEIWPKNSHDFLRFLSREELWRRVSELVFCGILTVVFTIKKPAPVERSPTESAKPIIPEVKNSEECSCKCLKCTICWIKELECEDDYFAATLCGHIYCNKCKESILRMGKSQCPLCKRSLEPSSFVRLYI